MSDKKIQVELTEATARAHYRGECTTDQIEELHHALGAALPPEYVRGGTYRVQCKDDDPAALPPVGFWDGSAFVVPTFTPNSLGGYRRAQPEDVRHVEPLRVLADDEIAVNLGSGLDRVTALDLTRAAKWLREERCWFNTPAFLERTADALEAKARP